MAFYNPMYMISRRPPPIETVGGVLLNSSAINGTAQYVLRDVELPFAVLFLVTWRVMRAGRAGGMSTC